MGQSVPQFANFVFYSYFFLKSLETETRCKFSRTRVLRKWIALFKMKWFVKAFGNNCLWCKIYEQVLTTDEYVRLEWPKCQNW